MNQKIPPKETSENCYENVFALNRNELGFAVHKDIQHKLVNWTNFRKILNTSTAEMER